MKKLNLLHKDRETDLAKIIEILLSNRGMEGSQNTKDFINPSFDLLSLSNTDLDNQELNKAAIRINQAIVQKESIVVYTDYDVDGLCSGAIVWECLYSLGANIMPYVPDRIEEGYGLSKKGLDSIKKSYKVKLLITVDHGVTALPMTEYAKSLGMDIIILDHHLLPKNIPNVSALIHTTKMCSGGIAWFFAHFLYSFLHTKVVQKTFLDLAALATVADLVPLKGLNRTIVKYGLEEINKKERVGLKALITASSLNKPTLEVYDLSFILAPRINAIGRLSHAMDALRLLCTKDELRAKKLAQSLCDFNKERQLFTKDSTMQAIEMIKHDYKYNEKKENELAKLLFISHKDFKEGILGLIAGKLVEEFYRPAIVVSQGPEISKASARSITGFNIVEALRSVSDLIIELGGHPMAAGFTVKTVNLDALKSKLLENVSQNLDEVNFIKAMTVDMPLDVGNINFQLVEELSKFSPFGIGNPEPVFLSRNLEVIGIKLLGRDKKHLKMTLRGIDSMNKNIILNGVGFNMGKLFNKIMPKQKLDVVYNIQKDNWGQMDSLQLKIKDVNLC